MALAYARVAEDQGISRLHVAASLDLSPRTLSSWRSRWKKNRLPCKLRGRPCRALEPFHRAQILEFLKLHWPHACILALRRAFPEVATRALEDLHRRYSRFRRRKDGELLYSLTWLNPGRVWAADYSETPCLVDGLYKKCLLVRDLASGKTLEVLPVDEESAAHTRNLLLRLFLQYGPPLVLKSDNGSTLTAALVAELLDRYGVIPLVSPPYWPRYNGACEAGNGSIKTRAHHIAAAHDRVDDWCCDDLEAARIMANELVRPGRYGGVSPQTAWDGKTAITEEERESFKKRLQNFREAGLIQLGEQISSDATNRQWEDALAKCERDAVRRTLESSGLLVERRKRVPLPNQSRFAE